ncbi:FliI/YscN family ATPase [Candidatus Uabimicrobium amorphum]|nr:FliI/YscN family ATPase [Candidatus Uabimicrobium amorphum]
MLNLNNYRDHLRFIEWAKCQGHVERISGLIIECSGIAPKVGEMCYIINKHKEKIPCEVIGIQQEASLLMPLETLESVGRGDRVEQCHQKFTIRVGDFLQGMVLNGLGKPLDKSSLLKGNKVPVERECPNPLLRPPIEQVFQTSIRAIDGLLTCGKGQRIGIFAGSGVGKSTLMGSLVRNSEADISVIALIGERGREVMDFINHSLGRDGLAKSVLVVATSDASPIERYKACLTALTIAEYFRDQQRNVLFLCDSMTRVAMAIRDIGLARKEPPTLRGYPPSLYNELAKMVERLGNTDNGSITGFLTVLVEGDDFNEPVADTMRGLLDGHIILDRELAQRGHFPAISILKSVSRVMNDVIGRDHQDLANRFRHLRSAYTKSEELINIGAYKHGSNPLIDMAIKKHEQMEQFLRQDLRTTEDYEDMLQNLGSIVKGE